MTFAATIRGRNVKTAGSFCSTVTCTQWWSGEPKVSTRILMLSLMEDSNGLFESAIRNGGGDVDVLRQALIENPVDGDV